MFRKQEENLSGIPIHERERNGYDLLYDLSGLRSFLSSIYRLFYPSPRQLPVYYDFRFHDVPHALFFSSCSPAALKDVAMLITNSGMTSLSQILFVDYIYAKF